MIFQWLDVYLIERLQRPAGDYRNEQLLMPLAVSLYSQSSPPLSYALPYTRAFAAIGLRPLSRSLSTPSYLSIGITTLLGSILTRNRLLPLRIITPPTFLLASTAYFLPKHFGNITSYTAAFEQTHTPELYKMQLTFAKQMQDLKSRAVGLVLQGSRDTQEAVARVAPWIDQQTGLNFVQRREKEPSEDK